MFAYACISIWNLSDITYCLSCCSKCNADCQYVECRHGLDSCSLEKVAQKADEA